MPLCTDGAQGRIFATQQEAANWIEATGYAHHWEIVVVRDLYVFEDEDGQLKQRKLYE